MNILTVISLFRDKKQLIGRHTQVSCFSKHSFFSAFHLIFLIETICEAGSLFYRVHHFLKQCIYIKCWFLCDFCGRYQKAVLLLILS